MRIENYFALKFIINAKRNKEISGASLSVVIVIAISVIFFISAISIMNGYILGIMKIYYEVKTFHIDYPVGYSYKRANLSRFLAISPLSFFLLNFLKIELNIIFSLLFQTKLISNFLPEFF